MTPLQTHRTPEPRRLTYAMVDDGIVTGHLSRTLITCEVCGTRTCGIEVGGYDLPQEVPWTSTIIKITPPSSAGPAFVVVSLGIGCGCYARFHRQVAHIKDKARSEGFGAIDDAYRHLKENG